MEGDTPRAVAKQTLETSPAGVAEIGQMVGYFDPAFFRQLFQRKAGIAPSEYRRHFGRAAA